MGQKYVYIGNILSFEENYCFVILGTAKFYTLLITYYFFSESYGLIWKAMNFSSDSSPWLKFYSFYSDFWTYIFPRCRWFPRLFYLSFIILTLPRVKSLFKLSPFQTIDNYRWGEKCGTVDTPALAFTLHSLVASSRVTPFHSASCDLNHFLTRSS